MGSISEQLALGRAMAHSDATTDCFSEVDTNDLAVFDNPSHVLCMGDSIKQCKYNFLLCLIYWQ